jgi:benzylsuccinate CoA-transferase BbsF subunit
MEPEMGKGTFSGVKVLEFAWVIAGPRQTAYLADQGATVVRIESKHALDTLRSGVYYKDNIRHPDRAISFASQNVNRMSIALNLKHPKGIEIAKKLIAWADVVTENFSPGQMEKWGLSYEEIKKINPSAIYLRASILGQTGPYAKHPGYGILANAISGITALTGWPDRIPATPFGGYSDTLLPRLGAVALLAALVHRKKTGRGQCLEISQLEAVIHFITPVVLDYLTNGVTWEKQGNRSPHLAPHNAYRCKGEDRWCAIAVGSDEEWEGFKKALGHPPWAENPYFTTLQGRKKHEEELDALIEGVTRDEEAEAVMEKMQSEDVPAYVVLNIADVFSDPQFKHRSFFWLTKHALCGDIYAYGQPFFLSKSPFELRMPAPCLGEHTDQVCAEFLKMPPKEIEDLKAEGVFE